jgi:hypothetical protein
MTRAMAFNMRVQVSFDGKQADCGSAKSLRPLLPNTLDTDSVGWAAHVFRLLDRALSSLTCTWVRLT